MARKIVRPGDPAPDFDVQAVDGTRVRLSDYRGAPVLLSFYRYVTCPVCNLRIQQLAQQHERFSQRLNVLAVFESPNEFIHEYVARRGLPFPLIGDPDGRLYARYGVKRSWLGMLLGMLRLPTVLEATRARDYTFQWSGGHMNRVPADFLIGADGTIEVAHYGSELYDHLPFRDIDAFAARPETAAGA